jgi:cytochrome c
MEGIIRYMEFLTLVYKRSNPVSPAPHGFPPVKSLAGDYCNGRNTFLQKCAVCHQADGQGRYEGGYYRPALWGPESFNQNAGMFSHPELLARFVSWNMPLGAGGLLTDQEAWDLEVFLHAQSRPGAPSAKLPACKP